MKKKLIEKIKEKQIIKKKKKRQKKYYKKFMKDIQEANKHRQKIEPEIIRAMTGKGSFTWDGKENLASLIINEFNISELPHKKYIQAYVNGYIEKRIKIMKKMSKIIKKQRLRWRLYIYSICTYTIKVTYNREKDTYNLTFESIFVTPERIYVKCTGRCYRYDNFSKEK